MGKSISRMEVRGVEIATKGKGAVTYISLTDIAKLKNPEHPGEVISKWMSNKDSFDFYNLWEELFNANFNIAESRNIKINEVGLNAFIMSPAQWKRRTNAIGIIPSAGKYSEGTFAHPDIAMEFASWIDTAFKLYLIKEFQRLKTEEQKLIGWSAKRELSKINYRIQTDAIKDNIIPSELTQKECAAIYADEADILNVALFHMTAKAWRDANEDKAGNIRDNATIEQLLVLANLESLNAEFIRMGLSSSERIKKLNAAAISQMKSLIDSGAPVRLENWSEEGLLTAAKGKKK